MAWAEVYRSGSLLLEGANTYEVAAISLSLPYSSAHQLQRWGAKIFAEFIEAELVILCLHTDLANLHLCPHLQF